MNVCEFKIGNKIGHGGFSSVHEAIDSKTGEKLVVKIIKRNNENTTRDTHIQDEISVLSNLMHPNIVRYKNYYSDLENVYIFMEYCQGQSLLSLINERNGLSDKECKKIMNQLLSTLDFLHGNNVCHRDIKPENIIVDQGLKIKLIDFGLCKVNEEDKLCNTLCGSYKYTAPECFSKIRYNGMMADMWSTGIVLYAMVSGQLPWGPSTINQQITEDVIPPPNASPGCADMISSLLKRDPYKRITAQSALAHYWLSDRRKTIDDAECDRPKFFNLSFNPNLKIPFSKHGLVCRRRGSINGTQAQCMSAIIDINKQPPAIPLRKAFGNSTYNSSQFTVGVKPLTQPSARKNIKPSTFSEENYCQ